MKGLRELKKDHPEVQKRIVICLENHPRQTEDGISIVPYQDFINDLYQGIII